MGRPCSFPPSWEGEAARRTFLVPTAIKSRWTARATSTCRDTRCLPTSPPRPGHSTKRTTASLTCFSPCLTRPARPCSIRHIWVARPVTIDRVLPSTTQATCIWRASRNLPIFQRLQEHSTQHITAASTSMSPSSDRQATARPTCSTPLSSVAKATTTPHR